MIKTLDQIVIGLFFIGAGSAFTVGNFIVAVVLAVVGNYLFNRYNINYPPVLK